jgi:hypothetical protein
MTPPNVERSADKLFMDLWMILLNETRANAAQELDRESYPQPETPCA